MTVTVIWRQLLPDWKSEMNELVDVHSVFGVYVYMFLVYVYNYVSGAGIYNYVSGVGVYMLLVRGYVCVSCSHFVLNLFNFKILYLSCYFALKKIGGPFSGQPDIPEDCQISQLGSPADCQIFWSYFYP